MSTSTTKWVLDPTHSEIGFKIKHLMITNVSGNFNKFDVKAETKGEDFSNAKVSADIEVESINTNNAQRDAHLRAADFFEVEKFPKASFHSTKIVADSTKGANAYTVTGDLELRGIRKSVTFPATIAVTPADVTVNSEFAINRKDFGIVYAGKADDLIRDDVAIKLDLKTPRKK